MPGILIISLLSFRKTAPVQDAKEEDDVEAAKADAVVLSSVTEMAQKADLVKNNVAGTVPAMSHESDNVLFAHHPPQDEPHVWEDEEN